jgi:hypothetical protein
VPLGEAGAFVAPGDGGASGRLGDGDASAPPGDTFVWPDGVSRKVRYRLLGNSVNVCVVAELVRYLFEA